MWAACWFGHSRPLVYVGDRCPGSLAGLSLSFHRCRMYWGGGQVPDSQLDSLIFAYGTKGDKVKRLTGKAQPASSTSHLELCWLVTLLA